MTTWQILAEWTATFTPVLNRTLEIAKEFVPYFIWISIWIIWVVILRNAVKMIIWKLMHDSYEPFKERRKETIYPKDYDGTR